MRPEGCEAQVLHALASMPLLDRTEMVALTGRSKGAVYEAVDKLDSGGFCDAVTHQSTLLPPAERFHLTAAGLDTARPGGWRLPWTRSSANGPFPPAGGAS